MTDYTEHLISLAGGDGDTHEQGRALVANIHERKRKAGMPDLDQIQARVDAATEGPWVSGHHWDTSHWIAGGAGGRKFRPSSNTSPEWIPTADDATFIAHARTDVPALLAVVRSQQAAIDLITNQINAAEMLCRMNGMDSDSAVVPAGAIRAALTATDGKA